HQGNGFTLAQNGGVESVTLTAQQITAHTHPLLASTNNGNTAQASNLLLGASTTFDLYIDAAPAANMAVQAIGSVGGSQPHNNFQPYLCVDFIISLFGIFPSPT
ncbi:MAG: phage tail protein, partial [Chloroflexi bacterium]|nr:phage tail protein [Chloroflexota bacterium]